MTTQRGFAKDTEITVRSANGLFAMPAVTVQFDVVSCGTSKGACAAATTGDHALAGLADVDDYTPSANDRILVWQQADGTQNGLYRAQASAWIRCSDWDSIGDGQPGSTVYVLRGTLNGGKLFASTNLSLIDIGVDSLTFQLAGGGGGSLTPPVSGGDDYKIPFALSGDLAYSTGLKTDSSQSTVILGTGASKGQLTDTYLRFAEQSGGGYVLVGMQAASTYAPTWLVVEAQDGRGASPTDSGGNLWAKVGLGSVGGTNHGSFYVGTYNLGVGEIYAKFGKAVGGTSYLALGHDSVVAPDGDVRVPATFALKSFVGGGYSSTLIRIAAGVIDLGHSSYVPAVNITTAGSGLSVKSSGTKFLQFYTDRIQFQSPTNDCYISMDTPLIGDPGYNFFLNGQNGGEGAPGGQTTVQSGSGGDGGSTYAAGGPGSYANFYSGRGGHGYGVGAPGGSGGSIAVVAFPGGNSTGGAGGDGGHLYFNSGAGGTGAVPGRTGNLVFQAASGQWMRWYGAGACLELGQGTVASNGDFRFPNSKQMWYWNGAGNNLLMAWGSGSLQFGDPTSTAISQVVSSGGNISWTLGSNQALQLDSVGAHFGADAYPTSVLVDQYSSGTPGPGKLMRFRAQNALGGTQPGGAISFESGAPGVGGLPGTASVKLDAFEIAKWEQLGDWSYKATFDCNVHITGKLDLDGLLDPTGVVCVDQAAVPGGWPVSGSHTLWVRTDGTLIKTDSVGTDIPIGGGFTPGGDLAGSSVTQTVIGLQQAPLTDKTFALDTDGLALRHHRFNIPYDGVEDGAGNVWVLNSNIGQTEHPTLYQFNATTQAAMQVLDLGPNMASGHYYVGIVFDSVRLWLVGVYDGKLVVRSLVPSNSPVTLEPILALHMDYTLVPEAKVQCDGSYLYVVAKRTLDSLYHVLKIDLNDPMFTSEVWPAEGSGLVPKLQMLELSGSNLFVGGNTSGTVYKVPTDFGTATTNSGSFTAGVVQDGKLIACRHYEGALSVTGFLTSSFMLDDSASVVVDPATKLLDVVADPGSTMVYIYCELNGDPFVVPCDASDYSFLATENLSVGYSAVEYPKARWFGGQRWLFHSSPEVPTVFIGDGGTISTVDDTFDDLRWSPTAADVSTALVGDVLKAQSFPWNQPVAVTELGTEYWVVNSNQEAAAKYASLYRVDIATGRCVEKIVLTGMTWAADVVASNEAVWVLGFSSDSGASRLFRVYPRVPQLGSIVTTINISASSATSDTPQRLLNEGGYIYALFSSWLIRVGERSTASSGLAADELDLATAGPGGANADMVLGGSDLAFYGDSDARLFVVCTGSEEGLMRVRLGTTLTYELGGTKFITGVSLAFSSNHVIALADSPNNYIRLYDRDLGVEYYKDISAWFDRGSQNMLNMNAFSGDVAYFYWGNSGEVPTVLSYNVNSDTFISTIVSTLAGANVGAITNPRLYKNTAFYVPVVGPVSALLSNFNVVTLPNEVAWGKDGWTSVYWGDTTLNLTGNGDSNGIVYRLDTNLAGGNITVTLPTLPGDGDEIMLKQITSASLVYLASAYGTIETEDPSVNWQLTRAGTQMLPWVHLKYSAVIGNWEVIGGAIAYGA